MSLRNAVFLQLQWLLIKERGSIALLCRMLGLIPGWANIVFEVLLRIVSGILLFSPATNFIPLISPFSSISVHLISSSPVLVSWYSPRITRTLGGILRAKRNEKLSPYSPSSLCHYMLFWKHTFEIILRIAKFVRVCI